MLKKFRTDCMLAYDDQHDYVIMTYNMYALNFIHKFFKNKPLNQIILVNHQTLDLYSFVSNSFAFPLRVAWAEFTNYPDYQWLQFGTYITHEAMPGGKCLPFIIDFYTFDFEYIILLEVFVAYCLWARETIEICNKDNAQIWWRV